MARNGSGSGADTGSGTNGSGTNTGGGSTTQAPPPPPPGPEGPTGTSGFLMGESSIQGLQKYAVDLESSYQGISSQLSSQQLAPNALGMFGIPMVMAVNGSNTNSVNKANEASATMGKVNDGLKATAETSTKTDQFIADQFGKIVPDSGAKNPAGNSGPAPKPAPTADPKVAPVEQINGGPSNAPPAAQQAPGPEVSKVDPVAGGPLSAPPASPTQTGPQVNSFTPPPGVDTTGPAAVPAAQGGPQVSTFTPPPGVDTTNPAAAPAAQGGPQVGSFTPPPGAPGTTNTAWTPPPVADPVARVPGVPGAPGVPSPNTSTSGPNGPLISQMPNIPGANGPVKVQDRPNIPKGRPPAGGPLRPGAVPNVPGVNGPPQGEFSKPTKSAMDSLRPINTSFPPQGPPVPPPFAPVAPPSTPTTPMPVTGPFPPSTPPPVPPVVPLSAPPNILDLIDPGKDQHTNTAWPATTIDGKPWADLSDFTNLPPEQRQMWIDNLKNVLATKEDGAFFWSGNVWDAQGERISVMYEAEEQAHGKGRNTLEGMLDDKALIMPGWTQGDTKVQELWDSVSSSVAHGSSGEVHVLLGPSRRPDNVFDMNEYPILEQNDAVRKVIAIDLMNNNRETVILDKGPR